MAHDTEWAEGQKWEETSLTKGERSRLRKIIGACLLGAFVAAVAVLGIKEAKAEPAVSFTWPNTSNKVTLHMTPCELKPWFKTWKRAVYLWEGQSVEACWKAQRTPEGDLVFTLDAQGDIGQIPVGAFTRDEGV
jgi:hypothetical protein